MNNATIHTAIWALKKQYSAIASSKPEPVKGTGDYNLRGLAMVNIRMALEDLQSQLPGPDYYSRLTEEIE